MTSATAARRLSNGRVRRRSSRPPASSHYRRLSTVIQKVCFFFYFVRVSAAEREHFKDLRVGQDEFELRFLFTGECGTESLNLDLESEVLKTGAAAPSVKTSRPGKLTQN